MTVDKNTALDIIRIRQDGDLIAVDGKHLPELIDALASYIPDGVSVDKEPEPTLEKWYVVLKNSNSRLTTHGERPTVFTDYEDARRYGAEFSGRGRFYVPMSVNKYLRIFGR